MKHAQVALAAALSVLIAAFAGSPVHAQKIQCTPQSACASPVVFAPTQNQYGAAIGGDLLPTTPTSPITLKLHSNSKSDFAIDVTSAPWTPAPGLNLEVRLTFSGPNVPGEVVGWLPVGQIPPVSFTAAARKVDVSVEYRLAVTGTEPPGTYATEVSFSVHGTNGGGKAKNTVVSTSVIATVPAVVLLRLDGVPVGQSATVAFDYTGANLPQYLSAVTSGGSLAFTGASFSELQVATNNSTGYRVDVSVTENLAPPGSTLGIGSVLLFGSAANGQVLTNGSATTGFQTLLVPSDFRVQVNGSETPGAYGFTVTYRASPNP